jgi:hypothetical protein
VVLPRPKPEKKREREGRKKKMRGKFPPLSSLGQNQREKREKGKRGRVQKREVHALVHVPHFGKKCKCTNVGEIKGKRGGDGVKGATP